MMKKDPAFTTFAVDATELPEGVRVYGTGHVGGKAKGLVMAMKAYEERNASLPEDERIHFPRSYILCSGYFDQFMEENYLYDIIGDKCRNIVSTKEMNLKISESPLPSDLEDVLYDILEKETGPIIVRSSSFFEDSVKYSFAGIFESIFLTNTGTLEYRMKALETAIRDVYRSTFNENAKEYRKRHKIPWQKEKMSIIVQNVIGRTYGNVSFLPLIAGVAFSRNYYPWNERINKDDGVGRIVLGLGTQAVGRAYARVFSLSNPRLRPEGSVVNEIVRYSQTTVDLLDLSTGEFQSRNLDEVKRTIPAVHIACSTLQETQYFVPTGPHIGAHDHLVPTFDKILNSSRYFPFTTIVDSVLRTLEETFGVPVDIEFAIDVDEALSGTFYLVQARPLGSRPEHRPVTIPHIDPKDIILKSSHVLGNGFKHNVPHIVYVSPETFTSENAYAIAREIGALNELLSLEQYILIGPGRWGTSNPELGVPVRYGEISNASVIVELSTGKMAPELSYGTHFFGDLMTSNTLYLPVFPEKGGIIDTAFFESQPNRYHSPLIKLISHYSGFGVYVSGEKKTGIVCLEKKPDL